MSDRVPKIIFASSLSAICLTGALGYGAMAQRDNLFPIPQLRMVVDVFQGDAPLLSDDGTSKHLQPSRGQGSGVVTNDGAEATDLVFLNGFFDGENQARLVRRDGSVVHKWSLDYFEIFADAETRVCDLQSPLFVDVHGTHLNEKGELVFNFEYCGTAKIDHCGKPLWTISEHTHHSVIAAEAGGYWALGRWIWPVAGNKDRFLPFSNLASEAVSIREDTLMRIDAQGNVLEEVSIPDLMRASGLEALMTATGTHFDSARHPRTELVHTNKVAELTRDRAEAFPLFEAGDLAISMRQLNLVMVLDPETKQVKWHQTGPWLRQHDPEFRTDGRISIFNNNVYRSAYIDQQTDLSHPRVTNIVVIDPVTRETEVVYEGNMLSVIRGQHELLENGNILITEFDAGRVLEVTPQGEIVWDYINAYDEDHVGEITNSAVFSADFFETDFSGCT